MCVQQLQSFFELGENRGEKVFLGGHGGGIECAGEAKNSVQVRLGDNAVLRGGGAEGFYVRRHQLAIECERCRAALIEREIHIHVAARKFFFQYAAQRGFHQVGIRRKTKMQIEEFVVHRFQRKREREVAADLSLHLRETGHGADGH